MLDITEEFTKCLGTMSHSRADWDYELPKAQRVEEGRQEKEALARAREIWSGNPGLHDRLRDAFKAAAPLATMTEIEQVRKGIRWTRARERFCFGFTARRSSGSSRCSASQSISISNR